MNNLSIILAILPFIVFIYLIFIRKITLLKASFLTLIFYTALSIFYWQILPKYLLISFEKGFLIAIDIFIIIFGAILFLEILKSLNVLKNISHYLSHISKDYRVQIIVIAWFFESFLEGTAGFGTPSAVAVPLLIGVGLSPLTSLIVGLLGNSVPGVFGAAGTPIKVGFSTLPVSQVPYFASIFNLVGIIIPIFMMWVVTRKRENKNKEFIQAIPFALWSGILFLIPSFFAAKFLGQEFPTIVGSIIGLVLAIISIRLKIFTPKENISLVEESTEKPTLSPLKSFMPYILLIVLLIAGKFILGNINIPVNVVGFIHKFNLFNPGLVFIIVSFITIMFWKKIKIPFEFIKTSFQGAGIPFLTISFMLIMVQIMINSGNNLSSILSPINLLAQSIESSLIPFIAPFAGAFGAFLTGSVTTSNVMFGTLFHTAATSMNIHTQIVLALLVAGAALGNMIAMADILTAEAVIGAKNQERKIIKGVIVPCIICLVVVGLFGMLMMRWYN